MSAALRGWSTHARAGVPGHLTSLTLSGLNGFYVNAFDFVYLPVRWMGAAFFQQLRVGGVVIDMAVDLMASLVQNVLAVWIWRRQRHRPAAAGKR